MSTPVSKIPGYSKSLVRTHIGNYPEALDMEFESALYPPKSQVPRLPVPKLEDSLAMFLKSARPHVTAEEYKNTEAAVKEFLKEDGFGRVLQKRLEERAKERNKNSSWFIEWWNDWAYMSYFDSVVYNVTYYLKFLDEAPAAMSNPCRRAARFVYHSLAFRDMVVNGTLQAEKEKDGTPWETSQYKYMFNTCRMPGGGPNNADTVLTYAPDVFTHIVVARKNRFYTFDVIDKATGKPLPIEAIQKQLERAKTLADAAGADEFPVGILTGLDRDKWAVARPLLLDSGKDSAANKEALERIQSAIYVICLDDKSPVSREDVGRALLHSDGKNRFWDKSIQVVFFENGIGGYLGEHSMMDGMTTTRFVNFTLEQMWKDSEAVQNGTTSGPSTPYAPNSGAPLPEPSVAKLTLTDAAKKAIKDAEVWFAATMATKELSVLMHRGIGGQKIKTFKLSPDAFAQLAIQLAYRMTFGFCRGTYESTATRRFLHGRTEVTRSCSVESEAFCDALLKSKESLPELHKKLKAATEAHSAYIGKASKGQGCDRHLLGLKFLVKPGETMPKLYSDPGYTRSNHWAISTSGLVGELMDGWGFGEVVPDGIGVGYSVGEQWIRYTVSSRHPQEQWAHRMTANLENALVLMTRICESQMAKEKAAAPATKGKL